MKPLFIKKNRSSQLSGLRWSLMSVLFIFFTGNRIQAQQYSFTHYDIQNGLAGSLVYIMAQDKEGFIWFGTETGLSRFDGTNFKNFTTADGLPDNEIINLFADSKGRIWIAPFRAEICYYYNGKIHNKQNDSLLRNLKLSTFALQIVEDSSGNIAILDGKGINVIKPDGTVITQSPLFYKGNIGGPNFGLINLSASRKTNFMLVEDDRLLKYDLKKLELAFDGKSTLTVQHTNSVAVRDNLFVYGSANNYVVYDLNTNKKYLLPAVVDYVRIVILNGRYIVNCTKRGAFFYDHSDEGKTRRHYLPDQVVTSVLSDNEGNLWFSTEGRGVFKLNSESIRSIEFKEDNGHLSSVTALSRLDSMLIIGSELESLYFLNFENGREKIRSWRSPYSESLAQIKDITILPDKEILIASGLNIFQFSPTAADGKRLEHISVKQFFVENEENLLAATWRDVRRIKINGWKVIDTVWNDRATMVFKKDDWIYIGALDGLYRIRETGEKEFLGANIPALRSRVTSIKESADGTLWIATYGNGIVGCKNNKVIVNLTESRGLTSNICKTLALHDNYLWIGTNRGVSKVSLSDTSYTVTKYTTADGLWSDDINAINITDSLVFIGSAKGLTYFDEKLISTQSKCDLKILSFVANDQPRNLDQSVTNLSHAENSVHFEFVAISFKSAGDIIYRYRLLGLDNNWQTTKNNFLNYPALQSGDYELQIEATNKFGIKSQLRTLRFSVESLIWERGWFQIILLGLLILLFVLLVNYFTTKAKQRESEKNKVNSKIAELEQLALKSQMNPHFVFNSLNSIQQYVMDKDIAGANKFITDFSKLIRQTMDFSSRSRVALTDELGYIQTYLELERNRLESKFDYSIVIDDELKDMEYSIPPMILQPYVENAIRHGIRYRRDNDGQINIRISKEAEFIICVIEDNGIGRKQAAFYKTTNPIEYQSKGMSLTADRIDLINRTLMTKVSVLIEDLVNSQMDALGTRVTVKFPENLS